MAAHLGPIGPAAQGEIVAAGKQRVMGEQNGIYRGVVAFVPIGDTIPPKADRIVETGRSGRRGRRG
jgi:hypothetical protein